VAVLRDGVEQRVSAGTLIPGDCSVVRPGEKIATLAQIVIDAYSLGVPFTRRLGLAVALWNKRPAQLGEGSQRKLLITKIGLPTPPQPRRYREGRGTGPVQAGCLSACE
jgi:hypothetical protein